MAIAFQNSKGTYDDKSVPDSGDGQSKSKFSNPVNKPTDNLKKPSQSANPIKDTSTAVDEEPYD